jgi:hypothetical protein
MHFATLAVVVDRLTGPEGPDDPDGLAQHFAPDRGARPAVTESLGSCILMVFASRMKTTLNGAWN